MNESHPNNKIEDLKGAIAALLKDLKVDKYGFLTLRDPSMILGIPAGDRTIEAMLAKFNIILQKLKLLVREDNTKEDLLKEAEAAPPDARKMAVVFNKLQGL